MFDHDDFPELEPIDLDAYFKQQIIYFYTNLTRKTSNTNVIELSQKLVDVLRTLKTQIRQNRDYIKYLELFYRMIGQTRDISNGKGEHELSYMMILAFYDVFPTLSIYAIHRFCKPIYCISAVGSWRDIKYLCEHVRLYSYKKENHEIISICIKLMNSQLKSDLETWKFSVNAGSRKHISNVAKWVPREKKKFNWLFEMLVIDWIRTNAPYMFENITDSWISAITKAKRIYRKKVVSLNKILDTTEIKQCSQKIDEIDPKNIACYTSMKQRALIYTARFNGPFEPVRDNKNHQNHYPIAFFIKEAMRLIGTTDIYEIELLNKQWTWFSKTIPTYGFENTLSILDVSFNMQKMDAESFYSAIGYAILIAERSNFGKRILAVDHQPTWINFNEGATFLSIVENICSKLKSNMNTTSNMDRAMELLVLSMIETRSTKRFMKNMTLILLSNLANPDTCIETIKKYGYPSPNIILWTMDKHNIREPINGVVFSGMSNGILKSLSAFISNTKTNNSSNFENISFILNNPRYDVFGTYLKKLAIFAYRSI
jgi:hypothetical protein